MDMIINFIFIDQVEALLLAFVQDGTAEVERTAHQTLLSALLAWIKGNDSF